jgi:hypothetical protein
LIRSIENLVSSGVTRSMKMEPFDSDIEAIVAALGPTQEYDLGENTVVFKVPEELLRQSRRPRGSEGDE